MGIARVGRGQRTPGRLAVPELEAAVLTLLSIVLAVVSFWQLVVGGSWPWAVLGVVWLVAAVVGGAVTVRMHRNSGWRREHPGAPLVGRRAAR